MKWLSNSCCIVFIVTAQSFEKEGLVLLRKKEEDLFSGVVKPRTSKRSKKEKKKTSHVSVGVIYRVIQKNNQ